MNIQVSQADFKTAAAKNGDGIIVSSAFTQGKDHRAFGPVNVTINWSGQINNLALYVPGLAAQPNAFFLVQYPSGEKDNGCY